MDVLIAISRLWSFDHHACDTALVRVNIDVWGVKLANGTPADWSVYGGSAFIVIWMVVVGHGSIALWTGRKTLGNRPHIGPPSPWVRLAALMFPAFGILCLVAQAQAVTNYVEACRAILHLQ
jgi:hypothetical protein